MPPKLTKATKTVTEVVTPTIIVHTLMSQSDPIPTAAISDSDDEDDYHSVGSYSQHKAEGSRPVFNGDGGDYADTIMTKDDINRQILFLDGLITGMEDQPPLASTKRQNKMVQNNHRYALNQHIAVRAYFKKRLVGIKKMEASIQVAKEVFGKDAKHSFKAKCIREWADHYVTTGTFKSQRQGKHPKTKTIILKPEVQQLLKNRLLLVNEIDRTPAYFMSLLNNSLLAEIPEAPSRVSKETARRWLHLIGFHTNNPEILKNYYIPPYNSNIINNTSSTSL